MNTQPTAHPAGLTYTTDSAGNELPITSERNPAVAFHFTKVGVIPDGTVWRCDTVSGRSLSHRLTFSSYYAHPARTGHSMGWLLMRQLLAHEATARWELAMQIQQAQQSLAA